PTQRWFLGLCALAATLAAPAARASGDGPDAQFQAFLKRYCCDCHGGDSSEARLDLEDMADAPDFGRAFKDWEKVVRVLRERKMPPRKRPQPDDPQRGSAIGAVEAGLGRFIERNAGDPGRVDLRRLTGAEYGYAVQDLTGVDLKAGESLAGDAVSGEGFTNAGAGQFMQDSTLERYLEAAKKVADHAVIGAGPLAFFADPGQTGRELSAITRIQAIYRAHGFRTAAGEGAEPFGLDHYPRAMFVAWQYRHRDALGLGGASLPELARREGLSVRLCEHLWEVLNRAASPFPLSLIISGWDALPKPASEPAEETRSRCAGLGRILREWQRALAASAGDQEDAAVLTAGEVKVASTHTLTADITWPKGEEAATIELSVSPASKHPIAGAVIMWRNPRVLFRREDGRRDRPAPLKGFVTDESAGRLGFGKHPEGAMIGGDDFVLTGEAAVAVTVRPPEGTASAQLVVDVGLETKRGPSGVVRCRIAHRKVEGGVVVEGGATSTLLADPANPRVAEWQSDVAVFARLLPEVSHREAAPSDRDPIPAPYDNAYNKPERNSFHTTIKYHRDDDFFVEHIADDATRRQLEEAWTDLLTSFEYHDANLRFLARKFTLDLGGRSIADLDSAIIDRMPTEPRAFATRWFAEFTSMRQALHAAGPGQVDAALRFAERAWRRPLSPGELERLRAFYAALRGEGRLDHPAALRALLARILVSPAFLYWAEPLREARGIVPLTDWQLASRLSAFAWSSLPDEELRRAASEGRLGDPEELGRQARRMLLDAKARRLATEFFGQWLGFYRFDTYQGIDNKRFPEFTDRLKASMYEEAVSFFEHVARDGRPVDEILFADHSYLNRQLAEHYGVAAGPLSADGFSRVEGLRRRHRGGLFGLGAVMAITSAPLRTSAVKRGDWVLRRVIGTPVPPPPADVGSILADDVSTDGLTVRRRLDAHRSRASCANCHSRIDPLGFALEQFDPIGRWRDTYRDGQAIDPSGTLSDGTTVSGPEGLLDYLRREKSQFHRMLCSKLLGYALGRSELASDRPLLDQMIRDIEEGRGFSDLVVRVVSSKQFRNQRAE
ncbi:MAG: DUF1592 domain-containing protein, partial [Planctomycetia bacterium]|nr:DUF1592 domain-containing protein [Planctomycetia bacterium]